MRPISAGVVADVPREQVFDYLSDIANHADFTDHYLTGFRLERVESAGVGAAARYRVGFPLGKTWAESEIVALERPHVIRLEGRMGRLGRIETETVYQLTQAGRDMTRIDLTFTAASSSPGDRVRELLGFRSWLAAKNRRALRRLAKNLEAGGPPTRAASVAAG